MMSIQHKIRNCVLEFDTCCVKLTKFAGRNGGVNPRNGGINSRNQILATFVNHGPLRLLGLSGCSIMSTTTVVRGWSIVRPCTMTLENDPEYQKLGIVG